MEITDNIWCGMAGTTLENSTKLVEPIDTRLEVAKIAGVSDNTTGNTDRPFANVGKK